MQRALPWAATVAVACVFALSACSPAEPTPTPTATNASPVPLESRPTQSSAADSPLDNNTPIAIPTASPQSQADALAAADRAMQAFAHPKLSADEWINGMYPVLSQAGAADFKGTDPAQIPVHKVKGPGTVVAASTEVALSVIVPTDAGDYVVALSRTDPTGPWLADRIRPGNG